MPSPTRFHFLNKAIAQFPLWPLLLGTLLGIFFADSWGTEWWMTFCFLGCIICGITRKLTPFLIIVGFLLGHGTHGLQIDKQRESIAYINAPNPVQVSAVILDSGKRGQGPYLAKIIQSKSLPQGVKIIILPRERANSPLLYGDIIETEGSLHTIPPARNPYGFDRQKWRHRQGADVSLTCYKPLISKGVSPLYLPERTLLLWQKRLADKMTAGLDPNSQEAQLIHAVVLGKRPTRSDEMIDDFRFSGTLHVFAVSGLHVGMVGSILALIFWLTRAPRWLIILLTIAGMILYAGITGLRPPAVRAVIMGSVFLTGFLLQRRPTLINSLAASAILVLLWDGHQLFTPGFQLSYGVLLAIALLAKFWMHMLHPIAQLDPFMPRQLLSKWQETQLTFREKLKGALSVSCAAWMGSAPLIWIYFGLITPIAIIAGLPLILMVFLILSLAILSIFVGSLWSPAGVAVNQINALVARTTHHTAAFFSDIPFGHIHRRPDTPPNGRVIVFDIPQGGAANLLQFGEGVLLDSGRSSAFRYEVLPALQKLRITPQSLVLTHADTKHIGGMSQCISLFHPKQALIPHTLHRSPSYKTFLEKATRSGCSLIIPRSGEKFPLESQNSNLFLEILRTPSYLDARGMADDAGLVTRLHWNDWKILFMGDAGILTEFQLLESGKNLTADIIVMGRHSDDISGHPEFIRAVNPQIIISSNADFPFSERIPASWKKQISAQGVTLIDQKLSGGITITLKNNELTLTPTLNTMHPIQLKHPHSKK